MLDGYVFHGSTTGTSRPSKCLVLRVAIVARRVCAIPAISVSRRSTARPALFRSAASRAAEAAAAESKSRRDYSFSIRTNQQQGGGIVDRAHQLRRPFSTC
jgi:hypothetical protein